MSRLTFNKAGDSPLSFACSDNANPFLIDLLIDGGADVNRRDFVRKLWDWALLVPRTARRFSSQSHLRYAPDRMFFELPSYLFELKRTTSETWPSQLWASIVGWYYSYNVHEWWYGSSFACPFTTVRPLPWCSSKPLLHRHHGHTKFPLSPHKQASDAVTLLNPVSYSTHSLLRSNALRLTLIRTFLVVSVSLLVWERLSGVPLLKYSLVRKWYKRDNGAKTHSLLVHPIGGLACLVLNCLLASTKQR